jgi:hemolysin activation/secretion protein
LTPTRHEKRADFDLTSTYPMHPFAPLHRFRFAPLPVLLAMGLLPPAHAQVPDAGTLQRQTDQELRAPQRQQPSPATAVAKPLAEDAKAVRVAVKAISVEGASLIPAAELEASLADFVGQSLTLAQLEAAAQKLADLYRARGWFARVYLPEQDVTAGVIRIQVLEGRYGGSRLENKAHRAKAEYVEGVVTHRLNTGEPLSAADLERGLLLANDLPGIRAQGLLEAGDQQGETRLRLTVEDTPFATGNIGLNNYGIKSTGRAQLVGGIALNDLSGYGDQLHFRALASDRLNNALIRYSLPLGPDGWRLAAHYSTLNYKLGKQYKALDADGRAQTSGLTLSYPLLRQADRSLAAFAGYEARRYDDDMLGTALHRHRIDAASLGLNGDLRDSLWGGAINWGNLTLTQGQLDIRDVAGDRATDAAGPRTQGDYTKLDFAVSRLQAIGSTGWQLQASLSGQVADGNLASSERMSLGGPNGVRAYPVNEATGDEGVLLKLELQRGLGKGFQAVGFVDTGSIRQHKDTWAGWHVPGAADNRYSLSGAGVGLNWRQGGWFMTSSIAYPIDGNPGKDANGRNNDGSQVHSPRFWLSLARAF